MAPAGGSCRQPGNSLMIIDHHHWYHHIIVRLWSWVLITICVWTVCQCAEIVEDSRPKTVVESNDLVQSSLCASIIRGNGYPCEEITVQTRDGFLLGLQHIPHGSSGMKPFKNKRAVYLQHGVIQAGDDWVLNSPTESLAFILADQGFDVWIGNVRGTTWSHGHITLTPESAKFWDWSFDEHAKFDLTALVGYVYNATGNQIYYVGHSQGSMIALGAFTMAETGMTNMVKAAVLLSPIAYLQHTTSQLVKAAADYMLDKVAADLGFREFSLYNEVGSTVVNWACAQDGVVCKDIVAATWGPDCCFNQTRYGYYLEWEPQPTSTKNMQHLAQMVRGSNFSMFDYGTYGNLKAYNQTTPPLYELGKIPTAFPMLLCSGGQDALADPQDVKRLLSELKSDVITLYLPNYAHADFVVGTLANLDVYPVIIAYFRTFETISLEGGHVRML
jgi:lysosomal acid lipase/cholesteryl ester hydrolase